MALAGSIPSFTMNITGPENRTETLIGGESKIITDLPYGEYTVVETPVDGFTATYNPPDGKVDVTIRDKYKTPPLIPKVTVTNTKTVDSLNTSFAATKTWENGNENDFAQAELELYRKLGDTEEKVNATPIKTGTAPNFTYTWNNLVKFDPVTGAEYAFSVKEVGETDGEVVINGRTYTVTYDSAGNKVTNTYKVPQTGDLKGIKVWSGTIEGETARPDVWFELWRSGGDAGITGVKVLGPIKLVGTEHNFGSHPAADNGGINYTYFVKEVDENGVDYTPANYVKAENGMTVTNTVKSAEGRLTIKKELIDNSTMSRMVLMAEPIKFGFTVTGPNNYSESFELAAGESKTLVNLYDGDYTVEETQTHGYVPSYSPSATANVTGTNNLTIVVTNKHTTEPDDPNEVKITATKNWVNGPTADHTSINLNLIRVSSKEGFTPEILGVTPIISGTAPNFTYNWTNLAKHDPEGYVYTYSVEEPNVVEGKVTINGNVYEVTQEENNITNTFKPLSGAVTGNKVWTGGIETNRPTVYFKLFRQIEGGEVEAVPGAEVKALPHGTLQVQWTVDKQDISGKSYIFTIKEYRNATATNEGAPANYDHNYNGLTVTNIYKSPTANMTFTKEWDGGKAPRPTVYFKLYRTTSETIEPTPVPDVEVKTIEGENLTATWENMPTRNPGGIVYIYSVKEFRDLNATQEGAPEGYEVDYDTKPRTVINKFQKIIGDIELTKTWDGGPDDDRPDIWFTLSRSLSEDGEYIVLTDTVKQVVDDKVLWEDIDLTDESGEPYFYKPFESNAAGFPFTPHEYEIIVNEVEKNVFEAVNTFVPLDDGSFHAEKIWDISTLEEDLTIVYPTMLFTLYRSIDDETWELVPGAKVYEIDGENTEADWSGLDKFDDDDNEYSFKVMETFKNEDVLNENWVEETSGDDIINRLIYNDDDPDNPHNPDDPDHPDEKLAKIVIKKRVTPSSAVSTRKFNFRITGPYGFIRTVSIGHGETVTLDELYYGRYTITEIGATGYAAEYSAREVVLRKSGYEAEIAITNRRLTPNTKVITGKKTWSGDQYWSYEGYTKPDVWFKLQRSVGNGPWEDVANSIQKVSTFNEVSWTVNARNNSGLEYQYRVREVDRLGNDYVPTGFIKSEVGMTVNNHKLYTPPPTTPSNPPIWPIWPVVPVTPIVPAVPTTPALNRVDHFGYVIGYPPGDFRPENTITRAEMTAIFARLLEEKIFLTKDYPIPYNDVARDAWYAEYIGMLTQVGVISGYPDGSFRPENPVTRAEFATVASRFIQTKKSGFGGFPDITTDYWAKGSIEAVLAEGWIKGYPDGSFRPERELTRAEAVTIVNRMLDRIADKDYVDANVRTIVSYTDLSKAYWAYYDIMEASNSHDYERLTNRLERWTRHWRPY